MTNFNEIRKRSEAIRQVPVEAMRKQDIAQLRVDNRRLIAEVERVVEAIDKAEAMYRYVDFISSHIGLGDSDEPQKNTAEAAQTK